MLVLSRAIDEIITIGDDIEVQIVEIRKSKIRLGIVAPRHVAVYRKEIRDLIRAQEPGPDIGDILLV